MQDLVNQIIIFLSNYSKRGRTSKYMRSQHRDPYSKPLRALHNPLLYSGDIIRYPKIGYLKNTFNAVPYDYWLWPNREIPYIIDPSLDKQKSLILEAMDQFRQHTCVRFRERKSTDTDYVRIFKGVGCYASIGKDDDNPEIISLGEGCYFPGTIVHELMHTVGYYHEQNRSDRDDFLVINWENIDEHYKDEFTKLKEWENKILTPFDYNSIMLYGPHSFSKDGMSTTMEPKHTGFVMKEVFDKPGLTAMDAKSINLLYKCQNS
ncbi:astacin-like metalloprotease toxin 5 isoform X2 [Oppia nitens]|uniref:astacin-like metalloprotease toxin 5 isoform X2 n=1 Tax=Oppia nitens TaxID=1686743 RepID=UPI0023DAEE3F|nr:astacin-like metalloprotease toxin 5 isoform X2 [Oppia nitens]XP_054166474.1 astacin-like metalloprotease toxin 5 isoform X2 [Oppia nitens]